MTITPIVINREDDSQPAASQQYITVLSYGDTRTGKCVTGDTRVLSPDGRYERIDDIIKWGRFATLSVGENGDGPLQATMPSHYHDMGISQVFALELADGRRLRGTPEHPVLTVEHGYVPLARLAVGDHVVVADSLPYFGAVEPADWEPRLLGYFIGDGSLTQGSPSFAQLRSDVLADFVSLVELAGDSVTMRKTRSGTTGGRCPQADVTGGKIKQWLADHGVWGRGSRDKFVPDAVFSWTPTAIKQFLRALFDCDGHLVTARPAGRTIDMIQLALVSTSRELLDGVGHLLRRFNIRTRIRYIKGMLNGVEHGAFELRVATLQGIADFVTLIGISRPNAEQIAADAQVRALKTARVDPGDLGDGLRCEAVKSIEAAGEAHVYDLTVPGLHNFLANDMVVHNTRFAATFPNVVVIADAGERGWDTIIHMPAEQFYHPGKAPLVLPVRDQAEMSAALTVVEQWVKGGLVDTVVIDSITFYAESWLQNTKRMFKGEPDNFQLYGGLLDHLAYIRKLVHGWPCNVVWLALAAPPENKPKRQGGPLLPGQSRDRFPPACQYCFYHRVWEATGDVEQPDGTTAKQSWLVYEARTQRWEDYLAGGRDNGRLPDPLHYPTYRMLSEHLGLPEFAPKYVPQDVIAAAFPPTPEPAPAAAASTTTKTTKAASTGAPPARRATTRSR